MSDFFQTGPKFENTFKTDHLLQRYLKTWLPAAVLTEAEPILNDLGHRAATDMLDLAYDAETHPPRHIPFDPWGRRIDDIETSQGWKEMEKIAAAYGLIATGYERKHHEHSRLFQMALLYLYSSSSAIYSCPLAMTDGAARAIELYGDEALKKRAFKHLTSRDPKDFWTSGQWMTEKEGGSDVSGTSTIAKKTAQGYELFGTKWFTSATTAQMAMTLARIEGAEKGSRGLSLFYLELRNPDGSFNGIEIHRLKDKLGTKALPTAELSLKGTRAQLVGGEGHGVKKIASLFNITRIYNSIASISHMRRALILAKDYSTKRQAFGKNLMELPLHQETFNDLVLDFTASFHLAMYAIRLLGKDETGQASADESALLRMLTPLSKLTTGKRALNISSEVVEIFGGAGYVEDTQIPRLMRDGQVFPIWEGTTNVLSLDVLRSIEKEGSLVAAFKEFELRLAQIQDPQHKATLQEAVGKLIKFAKEAAHRGSDFMQVSARAFSFFTADIFCGFLLCEFAQKTKSPVDTWAADRWLRHKLCKSDLAVANFLNTSPGAPPTADSF